MANNQPPQYDDCAFFYFQRVITPKWNINLVLEFITEGDSLSFSEISARIPEISPRMLSMRLKKLYEDGILKIIENEDKPKKVRYVLTESGYRLTKVLKFIREWSLEFGDCQNEQCLSNNCRHGKAISKLIELESRA